MSYRVSGSGPTVIGRGVYRRTASFEPQLLKVSRRVDGVRMLMPGSGSVLRRNLEVWFERHGVHPLVVAEFEDRALMKAFGERGAGVFTSPTAVEQDVLDKYGVAVVGRTEEIRERFYAISAERRIKHPAVSVIIRAARTELFV